MCSNNIPDKFLKIYGVTQHPTTKEYMIVMQYANDGNLLSYLDRNINKLTWMMKMKCLIDIADRLFTIHQTGLIHCDLHGGNIVLNNDKPFICDLGLSRSVNSSKSSLSNIHGVLPYVAPEVFTLTSLLRHQTFILLVS